MSLRTLKSLTAVLGAVPVLTGLATMLGVHDPIYSSLRLPENALLDSNLRFFGGVWLGLGVAVYWLIPRLETQVALFRAVWVMIFLGGIGRLLSMLLVGAPPLPFVLFTVLEVLGAPAFIAWHARLVRPSAEVSV
ncbi:DUF4345 domain-containing protein [Ramlibacter sp. PS4R-6]|uniref:DUF4345 domain-containing protein n=1 Tax=Ramlibacter sp. PS4R-6 TaxID=3133438 RepID=UPI0030A068CB